VSAEQRSIFAAVKLDNLPKVGPEEINVAYVVERQTRVESAINDIAATVQTLSSAQAASARLDQLSTVCRTSLDAHNRPEPDNSRTQSDAVDRQLNFVTFGVPEKRDASVWRRGVDDILRFVVDNSVDTVDMFRLERFSPDKSRPVLVTLRTELDKRLILSKRSKLRNFSQRGIFVESDEPVAVRRSQTIDRLKREAEREGKRVYANDGDLYCCMTAGSTGPINSQYKENVELCRHATFIHCIA
jgi:hypothetical protein